MFLLIDFIEKRHAIPAAIHNIIKTNAKTVLLLYILVIYTCVEEGINNTTKLRAK